MANNTKSALLRRGIDSNTAQQLVEDGYTVQSLQLKDKEKLLSLGIPELQVGKLLDGRPPIPEETFNELLHDSKWVCCICRERERGIIIHHIEEWSVSRSHDKDNLAVLCLLHHDEAHTKRGLTLMLTPDRIKWSKDKWYEQVQLNDASLIDNVKTNTATKGQKIIEVSNVKDFVNELGSDRIIQLKEGIYNLSEIVNYRGNDSVKWKTTFDGYEPHLNGIENLTITGNGKVEIIIDPLYAWVLRFNECQNLKIENITAGHSTPGSCTGGVFKFKDCEEIKINNCDMYGCGTYGITVSRCKDIEINNSTIRECTYGMVQVFNSREVIFRDVVFRNCEQFDLITVLDYCTNVNFLRCTFSNNYISWDQRFFIETDRTCQGLVIEYSTFKENRVKNWCNEPGMIITRHNNYSNNLFDTPKDVWFYDED